MQGELGAFDGVAEVAVEFVAFGQFVLHNGFERLDTVSASELRGVHCDVGAAQEFIGVERIVVVVGYADRRAHEHFMAIDRERCSQRVKEPLRQRVRVSAGGFVEDDRELVTAETCDGVTVSDTESKTVGYLDKKSISLVVAKGVVDHLEPVEIAEQDRDRRGRSPRSGQRMFEPVTQQRAVREARQMVVERLMGQLVD